MIYMLDTNIIIYFLKNKPLELVQRLNALDDTSKICMSFITYAELLKGAEKSLRKAQVIKQIKNFTKTINVEFIKNEKLCESYASNFTRLKDAGTQNSANDLWIACHAISLNATLVTNNVREFESIKELNVENWVNS